MDDLSFGLSVGLSVGLSSALCKNRGSDPDAVWHHRSDGSRHEAGSAVCGSVHGKGYFWGQFRVHHCNQWGLYGIRVDFRSDAALFPNYFGKTCTTCSFFCPVQPSETAQQDRSVSWNPGWTAQKAPELGFSSIMFSSALISSLTDTLLQLIDIRACHLGYLF